MVKIMILFRQVPGEQFEERYNQSLALLEKMPNIQRRAAGLVLGSPEGAAPFERVLEIYFENKEAMEEALLSPEGQAAGRYLMEFVRYDSVILYTSVYEDYDPPTANG